jgi:site-specific DNA-methyltransferase (adenine-specific)
MAKMSDCFVDLTVTSPPYDGLRTYHGYSFPFEVIAKEMYRVTKDGGIVVWVVSDSTLKGNESGTSFKQALYFKEIGFNLHDTMIWIKDGGGAIGSNKCYTQNFEYMFVFSKGKIKTTNLIYDKPNASFDIDKSGVGRRLKMGRRLKNGEHKMEFRKPAKEFSKRNNYWYIPPQKGEHPAVFPEKLANDHIISWSNEGDLVYDPFMGSGTTAKMCILNNRNWIGSEISKEYCDLIENRINNIK